MADFTGGIHLDCNKLTSNKEIVPTKFPKKVIIPLLQHTGAICNPLIKVGDYVEIGQKIADSDAVCSAPIHASISGKVTEIKEMPHPVGSSVNSIIIESDGKINYHSSVKPRDNVEKLTKEELLNIIKEAGIVGLGGAAFPTHVKLNVKDKKIDTVILNGAECEPYLTADHRLMLEQPEKIIKGLKLTMKIVGAEKGIIGVEDNKENAIAFLKEHIDNKNIEVASLKTKYPQGAEKMLIYALLKRKVPTGCLPLDVNVVVDNVATSKAIYDAVYEGKPLIERIVTVTGAVNKPNNFTVRIGTLFEELLKQVDRITNPKKLIMGGPMMGITQETTKVPVIKGTTGILVLDDVKEEKQRTCIKCARCVDACPMLLLPNIIAKLSSKGKYEAAEAHFALDCFECGCCAYVCPSKIPLVKLIKQAKIEISKRKSNKK